MAFGFPFLVKQLSLRLLLWQGTIQTRKLIVPKCSNN
jgi:hypothetical protein